MWWCCKLYLDTFIQKLFHTFHRVYSHNNCWRSDIVLQSALVVGSHLKWKCINKLNYMLQLNQEYSKKNIDKAQSMIIFKQKCHGKYKILFQCIRSTLYVYYSYICHRLKSGYDAPVYEPIKDMLENFFNFFFPNQYRMGLTTLYCKSFSNEKKKFKIQQTVFDWTCY